MKMKNIFFLFGLCGLLLTQACDTSERPENKTSVDQVDPGTRNSSNINDRNTTDAPASTNQMAYICPMKCEGSASNSPGKCPVCGMDLVKNPNYTGTAANPNTTGTNNEVLNHEPAEATGQSRGTDDQLEQQPR